MGALVAIVAFLILLNSCLVVVNQMGVGSPSQFIASDNVNITAVQSAADCSYNNATGQSTCNNSFGNIPVISTLVTFGDFLWSLAKLVILLPIVIGLPYIFLVQNFYAPPLIAALYNLVVWIVLIFYFQTLISGRYVNDIE